MAENPLAIRVRVDVDDIVFNKKHLGKSLRLAGNETARKARALLKGSDPSGRLYRGSGGDKSGIRGGYRKGAYRASAPGQPPARVSGTLARSIKVKTFRSGEGVMIWDTAFYALFLEAGATGGGPTKRTSCRTRGGERSLGAASSKRQLAPRHFITAAFSESVGQQLETRLGTAIRDGVRLARQK